MRRNEDEVTLEPCRGGWAIVNLASAVGGGPALLLRYHLVRGGRLQACQAYLTAQGSESIDVELWRSMPIARAETLANLPENYKVLVDNIGDEDAEVEIGGGAKDVQPILRVKRTRRSMRVPIPTTKRYPDGFYERVAVAYQTATRLGESPATLMAEANNVPATTTRRWFAEARRRGFYPSLRAWEGPADG